MKTTPIGLCVMCVALIFCMPLQSALFNATKELTYGQISTNHLKQVETIMGIKFPKGTKPVGLCFTDGYQDDTIHLKILVPKDELQPLIDKSPFKGRPFSMTKNYCYSHGSLKWWDARQVKQPYRSAQVILPKKTQGISILIDDKESDFTVVYLHWSTT